MILSYVVSLDVIDMLCGIEEISMRKIVEVMRKINYIVIYYFMFSLRNTVLPLALIAS